MTPWRRLRGYVSPYGVWTDVTPRPSSSTCFVLCSGPSLNAVTRAQWLEVEQHDSFGINYSFLKRVPTTFHLCEDPKVADERAFLSAKIQAHADPRAIWFVHDRHYQRGLHPRWHPELFPSGVPRVSRWPLPPRILLDGDRPFQREDMRATLRYRNTLSVVLHYVRALGYWRAVLLGCDLGVHQHFYDGYPSMAPYVKTMAARYPKAAAPYPAETPKAGTPRPMSEYLQAVDRWSGMRLQIGAGDETTGLDRYLWIQ